MRSTNKTETIKPSLYVYTSATEKDKAWSVGKRDGKGLLKVGEARRQTVRARVLEQEGTWNLDGFEILWTTSEEREDGTLFSDHDVHRVLENQIHAARLRRKSTNRKSEVFECTLDEVKRAVAAVRTNTPISGAKYDFKMRPEQQRAVEQTAAYFLAHPANTESKNIPHFLWNAKMRFGKTFAAYQLAKRMRWKNILVLTFKPAVKAQWEDDLKDHKDFTGWQFVSRETEETLENRDPTLPCICFASFQDMLGESPSGGIKAKNKVVHATKWDCIILDEYHFGAWRDSARELFDSESNSEQKYEDGLGREFFDEKKMPLDTGAYLYLSGTPFRALTSGEFQEDQIFNWTYQDEQRAKNEWKPEEHGGAANPYSTLPRMKLCLYTIPPEMQKLATTSEYNGFDLSEFFKAKRLDGKSCVFERPELVQQWLKIICAAPPVANANNTLTWLKNLNEKTLDTHPFGDPQWKQKLRHTLWFLPSVAACNAMGDLLRQTDDFRGYIINVCAGQEAGVGVEALENVELAMGKTLETKSITLTCGKLTTGVTVPEWSGIFMLRSTTSPETYFQAAFRIQSPWATTVNAVSRIHKEECYVFDYAPDRALTEITEYALRLSPNPTISPEAKIQEFINYLPVLAFGGGRMVQLNAENILFQAVRGGNESMLANRWKSPRMVSTTTDAVAKLMADKRILEMLAKIKGLDDKDNALAQILNDSGALKKLKKKLNNSTDKSGSSDGQTDDTDVSELKDAIQKKLRKINSLLPIFMYLTNSREIQLSDILQTGEADLFQQVTSLQPKMIANLIDMGLLNTERLGLGIVGFFHAEKESLCYTGINRYEDNGIL